MGLALNLSALLAEELSKELKIAILAFAAMSLVLVIFFIYQMCYYLTKFLKICFNSVLKTKAGRIIFSPYVGIPLFIILLLATIYVVLLLTDLTLGDVFNFFMF